MIFESILRGLRRILLLVALGAMNLLVAHLTVLVPELKSAFMAVLSPLCFGAGLVFLGLAAGDFALRILQPRIDAQDAAMHARRNDCTGSGLVFLGRCILAAAILMLMVTAPRAAEPPAAAIALLPVLQAEQRAYWPGMPLPSALGAQVEQETCITLRHRSCWSAHAELRTSRERGIGLGQLTAAFRADGSTRFDAMAEIVADFPRELAGLSWSNPYNATLQLRALVLKDRQGFERVHGAVSGIDQLAMSFSAYNGGVGGLAADRRMCASTPGCLSGRWFEHVERTSLKAKTAVAGYGKSFFEVNREYVRNVLVTRRARYALLDA